MTDKKHNYDWDAMKFDPDWDDIINAFLWNETPQGGDWWSDNKFTPEGQAEFARMKRLYEEDMASMESLDWFRLTRPLWPNDEKEGPVRTVTRKEIVSGQYGIVNVDADRPTGNPRIVVSAVPTVGELTAAIETLAQIRDALEA